MNGFGSGWSLITVDSGQGGLSLVVLGQYGFSLMAEGQNDLC